MFKQGDLYEAILWYLPMRFGLSRCTCKFHHKSLNASWIARFLCLCPLSIECPYLNIPPLETKMLSDKRCCYTTRITENVSVSTTLYKEKFL